jgi:hypothetical protein
MTQEFYHEPESTATITFTPDEADLLAWLAAKAGLDSPASLIEAFVGDLAGGARSGGSDERELAFSWYKRRFTTEPISASEAVLWRQAQRWIEEEAQARAQGTRTPYVTVPMIARLLMELRRRWNEAGRVPFAASHRELARALGSASVGQMPAMMRRLEEDGHITRLANPSTRGFLIALCGCVEQPL